MAIRAKYQGGKFHGVADLPELQGEVGPFNLAILPHFSIPSTQLTIPSPPRPPLNLKSQVMTRLANMKL